MQEVAELLPNERSNKMGNYYGRITTPVANFLLAKLALNAEIYCDDSTKNERMKADLITNVSHDIKTPLTSIINYVNLIKLEHIDNERVNGYIRILDAKSQRLKQLTEDLVETSRITSGNVKLDMQKIDLVELIYQTAGEFNEKFEAKELTIVTKLPKTEVMILADGRQLYRVIENLYNNVAKYALEKTRVYVDVHVLEEKVTFSIKNVSERSLALENSNAGDLTERFIRGDASRTTEGSGLGLSIGRFSHDDTAQGRPVNGQDNALAGHCLIFHHYYSIHVPLPSKMAASASQ